MGHMQMGFAAFLNGAQTAVLQGVDLFAEQAQRFLAASEFAAKLQLNVTSANSGLLCSGQGVKLTMMPTFEVAHANFVRLGLSDVYTQQQLTANVRPHANQIGSQVSIWETLSHGLPI